MKSSPAYDELKTILDNVRTPERLNDHPWTGSLVVVQGVLDDKSLGQMGPGYQLISVLGSLFIQMMPSTPPLRGKRLDTRWGQFGMLAAEYFGPFLYRTPSCTSLRDAGGRIDQAIPFFIFGKSGYDVPESVACRYRLFDDDTEPAPVSTLSDWHTMGLQRLAELFLEHEKHLSQKLSRVSPILHPLNPQKDGVNPDMSAESTSPRHSRRPAKRGWRWGCLVLVLLILVGLFFVGNKAWYIYQDAKAVKADLDRIQTLLKNNPGMATFGQAGPLLSSSRQDWTVLQTDVGPYLWMGKYLTWVPTYGGDLSQIQPLSDMANALLATADESAQAVTPLWQAVYGQKQTPKLSALTQLLEQAQPHVSKAVSDLNDVIAARGKLNIAQLSPDIRSLVTDKIDPNLPLLQEGLTFAMVLPKLAGASSSGPQTYLIFFQNEDELRATGGFLTDVGTIVVKDGDVLSSNFEDSYALDDLTKPYPLAPWQLEQYMDAHMLLLRDSNWSPDFPTSAALAETLYAYTRFHTSDGIVAIDQHAVQMLLTVLGPMTVEGVPYPISSKNVIAYMRAAKYGNGTEQFDPTHRKDFIATLGDAILAQITSGQNISLESLMKVLVDALNQKHILLQVADPTLKTLLAGQGWDGAIRPDQGDFLMVVDSNIGFTKNSTIVESKFTYDIDLSNPAAPIANLRIEQTNHATGDIPCLAHAVGPVSHSYQDFVDRCYWDYLRVYGPAGTQLLHATPHAVPGNAMLDGVGVPARVDVLREGIAGVQSYGTLVLVPTSASIETDFQFALPASVVQTSADKKTQIYNLHVQKQPGTLAIPINICVRLPGGAALVNATTGGKFDSGQWCMSGDLSTDIQVTLAFSVP